ncbi:hypothetical protein SAMN04489725_10261 [Alicyclobacillus hesperidum]|uniref:Uncharacterized protein n=1 Tax=Alicyclobacillus hesperidum TaxID=89784 RepID=A0A1H2QV50_9BACL|nr:hypothetical protein SAMN04489725_10261 [Alicyclobacillus hesperidum]
MVRRKVGVPRQIRRQSIIYTCAAIALGAYGIPRLPRMSHGIAGTFTAAWMLVLALSICANLYFVLGADKERKRLLEEQQYRTEAEAPFSHVRARARG